MGIIPIKNISVLYENGELYEIRFHSNYFRDDEERYAYTDTARLFLDENYRGSHYNYNLENNVDKGLYYWETENSPVRIVLTYSYKGLLFIFQDIYSKAAIDSMKKQQDDQERKKIYDESKRNL